ncbi:non-ribosomal peptide synthetase [Jeotgalibacillus campisalis]|uniref:Carrier domain-containing protein n=1 Tax=Jeotgalibacillus campisalis TaxID=220754 RepID=A0A0C2W388_9BACL|nr:non-ribosomal peptide synthetase [Jeotgalibacillus campisalis]KIL51086.1 hypothetical protein KR50_09670 [Jeotgalibacillus campisalis]
MNELTNKLINLSEEKRELLKKQIAIQLAKAKEKVVPVSREKNEYSLSLRQQRLFILDQMDQGNPFYNIPAGLRIKGDLQLKQLERAINIIIENQCALRTIFKSDEDGNPFQFINQYVPYKLEVFPTKDEMGAKDTLIREIVQTPFNLKEGPLWRISLLKEGEREHLLILSFHHILFDGRSLDLFIKELSTIYNKLTNGQRLNNHIQDIQYVDYAEWERKYFNNTIMDKQLSYWKNELSGCTDFLQLPLDKLRPKTQSFQGSIYTIELPAAIHRSLIRVCQTHKTTLFMVTLAAFQTLLSKYSNQEDVIVGFPISCRDQPELESLMGLFVNTLPLRADLSNNPSFIDLLDQVKEKSLQAFNNKHIPFDLIVEHLQPKRDLSFNPIFQVLFSYQNAILPMEIGELNLEFENIDPGTSKFDLSLDIFEGTDEIPPKLVFEYNTELFNKETIHQFAKHYIHILNQVSSDPSQRIGELSLLTYEEHEEKLSFLAAEDHSIDSSIVSLFEKRVYDSGNLPAVTHQNKSWTYNEVNNKANALARFLKEQGAEENDYIGICLDKSIEMVISVLAVLKLGAAYVPIDPHYPKTRINHMIKESQANLFITNSGLNTPEIDAQAIVNIDLIEEQIKQFSEENLNMGINGDQLAYINFTSGTTGNPKGVMISHYNLVNSYNGWEEAYELSINTTSHLQMASFSFDVCTGDIVRALLSGSKLVLCNKDDLLDPSKLYQHILDHEIDFAEFTPIIFRQLVQYIEQKGFKLDIACIVLGSDSWYMSEYKHFLSLMEPKTRLINSYGLTEDTVDTSYFEWNQQDVASDTVPIGKALLNKQLLIVDQYGNLVPNGVPGEIFVAGKGIARGYINRPDLTEERFIPNPFDEGKTKVYKTGDIGRYLRDGNVELIGRLDDQVKVRGIRIEISEVNSILISHPNIKESCVIEQHRDGVNHLIGYYTTRGEELTSIDLRKYMKKTLPEYMIPSHLIEVNHIPMSPNGKVDKKSLPSPDLSEIRITNYVGATTLVESMVQTIWEEAFKTSRIGINEDFFELGGHSLLAIQIKNQIQQTFSIELPVQTLFQSPTIMEIAKIIEIKKRHVKENVLDIPIAVPDPVNRFAPFPMTDIQQAYWVGRNDVFEFGNISTHSYDEMKALDLDINQFEYAWNTMVQRHDMLRAVINEDGTQRVLEEVPYYSIKTYDLEEADENIIEEKMKEIRNEMAHQQLPAVSWPTFDVRITKLPGSRRIHFSTDAIFWDAWSFVTVIKELVMVYQRQESELKKLDFTFRDYVLAEKNIKNTVAYSKARNYWKAKISSLPPAPELPLAINPASIKRPTFTRLHKVLNKEAWAELKKKSMKHGLTPTALLLAIYAEVLSEFSKTPSFSLNLTFLNRHHVHPQVNEVVGEFTSLMLLSVTNDLSTSFVQRAKKIQEELWNDLEHNYISGVEILREITRIQGSATQAKMPVVFTSALVVPVPDQDEAPIPFRPINEDGVTQTSQVWLDCGVWEDTKQLMCNWDVVKEVYPDGFVEEMFEAFFNLIELLADSDEWWDQVSLPILPRSQMIIREETNATEKEYNAQFLHSFMEEQLRVRPNEVFLQTTKEQLTFAEVDRKSNRVSQWISSQGVKPDQLVAIVMEKGWEQIVGILGILKANAAYVPISPTLPKDRIHNLIEISDTKIVLTQSKLTHFTDELSDISLIYIDDEARYSQYDATTPTNLIQPSNLAYVIFTSGSTGTPKGVMISHESAVNTILDLNERLAVDANDRILALSNLNFDLSVYDIFGALQAGSTIVIPDEELTLDPGHWYNLIVKYEVTVWNSVPQLMSLLTESVYRNGKEIPLSLRIVMMSGDWIPLSLPDQIKNVSANNKMEIFSLGGATEASIWSILYPIQTIADEWKSIPYGKPMKNQQIFILNHKLEYCPNWVPGHIYIGGKGLAQGYWKDKEKTRASFIFHPKTGERLYRTGDLGRYLPDGNIEFLGREDSQVKIQGYRIELGEIESTLCSFPTIKKAVVLVQQQHNGNKGLIAFYESEDGESSDSIKLFLEKKLPAYMIPGQFIEINEIPLSANGKVNRQALFKLVKNFATYQKVWKKPSTELEKSLALIWSEWLDVEIETIGIENNFFELGGDSMQAIRMISDIQNSYSQSIPLRQFYQKPTIKDLTELISSSQNVLL